MTDEMTPLLGVVPPPTQPDPTRVAVLKETAGLLVGERQEQYGTPQVNLRRIADIWNILLARKQETGEPLTPADVAIMLAGLKLARAAQDYKHDTAVDLAGYAAIWAEISEG